MEKENGLVQLHFMLPAEEKKQAVSDAHKMEMTLSQYIRHLLKEAHNGRI